VLSFCQNAPIYPICRKGNIMDPKRAKRLQAVSHKVNHHQNLATKEALAAVRSKLRERGYRADMQFAVTAHQSTGRVNAELRFEPELGHPDEHDLVALVAQEMPDYEIEWETINVDPSMGVIYLNLEPSVEMVPIKSMSDIPSEFVSIGTALYKRASTPSSDSYEIWSLKKTDNGLALFNTKETVVTAEDESQGYKSGDVVNTPYGPGKVVRFDDLGNAFVQIGKTVRLVAEKDMGEYSISKEKQKLADFYAQIYGPEYAALLVKEYGEK